MRTTSETSVTLSNTQHSNHRDPKEENKKKGHEKILEEIIVENIPKMGKGIITQVQETQRVPKKDKPKGKHPKTHINQINKDQTQRTQILKAARENQQVTYKGIPIRITADLSIEILQAIRK